MFAHRIALTVVTTAALVAVSACDNTKPTPAPTPAGTTPSTAAAAAKSAATASAAPADPLQDKVRTSRALVGRFATKLKAALMAGMSSGVPLKGVTSCNVEAPKIAAGIKLEPGWSIRRTSLKLRNPENAPDAWERATLESFDKQVKAGTSPVNLEKYDVVGGRFRYMKAIPTAAMCTHCHGMALPAALTAELDRLYPKDEARGYEVGQVRGAFSVTHAAGGSGTPGAAAGALPGKVIIGPPAVAGGTIAGATAVVTAQQARFHRCYAQGQTADPKMQGSVTLVLKVGADGTVSDVQGGGGPLAPIVGCLKAAAQSAEFTPPEGGAAVVSIPIVFVAK